MCITGLQKRAALFCTALLCSFLCLGCVSQIAVNSVSDLLAPPPGKGGSMMTVLTGESDPVLMGDFFPTALKLYEVMLSKNPGHAGLAVMTGSLYVMYANAFIQQPAERLDVSRYDEQNAELMRAKMHYLRGRDYAMTALEKKYPGITAALMDGSPERRTKYLAALKKLDVEAAYWAGSGWLGAFSVDILDPALLGTIPGAVALLERAAELDPDYNRGAIWEVLCTFYAAAPADMGGDPDKAQAAYEQAFRCSQGQGVSVYVLYAKSLCVPRQDSAGFEEALLKALAVDVDLQPETRLASVIAQNRAAWLLEHKEDFFLDW